MGFCMKAEDLLVKPPADAESADDVEEAVDDAAAQLLQVLEEAHAGHFFRGALLGFFYDGARHRERTRAVAVAQAVSGGRKCGFGGRGSSVALGIRLEATRG